MPKGYKRRSSSPWPTAWGISRSLLHRLLRGKLKGTTWRTLVRLGAWLGTDGELLRHALSQDARRRRTEYLGYLDREMARLRKGRPTKHNYTFQGEGALEAGESFATYARNRGLPATRAELANLRVVDPLVGWKRLRWSLLGREAELAIIRDGFRRERRLARQEAKILADGRG